MKLFFYKKINNTIEADLEIFLNVLLGSSDIDVKLLNELLNNYDISNIVIIENASV